MVAYRDRAVYLPGADALVLADLHLGRAEASNVDFPLGERDDLVDRLDSLLERFDPGEVVIAGDVLHSFGRVPVAVERSLQSFEETIDSAEADLVVTPGNHDSQLTIVYEGSRSDEYRLEDGTVVCHGHERPEATADRYVIGHDHPTIEIEGQRRPCYLYGHGVFETEGTEADDAAQGENWADVLMLPPFNRLIRGVTVNGTHATDLQSPLARRLNEFHPVVRDADGDETLRFPPLGELRSHL